MTNEPNAKLPEWPKHWPMNEVHEESELGIAIQAYARAAIALNTPGVDAQEPGAWMTQRALDRFAEHRAGNADAIGYSYAYAMQDEEAPVPLYTHPAPTGVYAAGKVEALVAKLRDMDSRWRDAGKGYLAGGIYLGGLLIDAADELEVTLAALAEGEKG